MIYSIENEKLWVQVNDYGAELWSVYHKADKIEHLWQGEASIWPRRAPICFPICGELTGGSCTVAGNPYTMPMHGFARDFVHTLIEKTATSLHFRLVATQATRVMYPFDFQLDSTFTLAGDTLTHAFTISNGGAQAMPYSIGYHTGYRCFHSAGETLADLELQFDAAEPTLLALDAARVAAGKAAILSNGGKTMQLVDGLFTDTIILKEKVSSSVTLYNRATKRGVKIGTAGFDTLLLWSCVGETPYLCIEPWHGEKEANAAYGDLADKPGMRLLAAGEAFTCAQTITPICEI